MAQLGEHHNKDLKFSSSILGHYNGNFSNTRMRTGKTSAPHAEGRQFEPGQVYTRLMWRITSRDGTIRGRHNKDLKISSSILGHYNNNFSNNSNKNRENDLNLRNDAFFLIFSKKKRYLLQCSFDSKSIAATSKRYLMITTAKSKDKITLNLFQEELAHLSSWWYLKQTKK